MTYEATSTVWLDPTDEVAIGLRRFTYGDSAVGRSGCDTGYHSALIYTGRAPAVFRDTDHGRVLDSRAATARDDPGWPTSCAGCGYQFGDDGQWQDWQELLYRRIDTGELVTLRRTQSADVNASPAAPAGAMWNAWWMPEAWRGADGIALMVRLPNGHDWHVDGEASNCTRKGVPHQCWVRHGDPRTESVHVDKDGDTCAAGAGSIQAGDYHGFLHGHLTAG